MPFSKFGLDAGILRAIKKAGYSRPTPVQELAIPKAMMGKDLIAIAQTGTGKTAAFLWPILHRLTLAYRKDQPRRIKALILAPTRELVLQIVENIRDYGQSLPIRVAAIYGGADEEAQIKSLHKGVQIVVATPGRLIDLTERRIADFQSLEVLVLDEADRMLHMGFRPNIETILSSLPKRRQTLMFSATFPKEVESLARRFQYQPAMVQIGKRSNPADTVKHCVYEVPAHLKEYLLLELLRQPEYKRVLVFTRMKDGTDRLTVFLKNAGLQVAKLHSSRSQEQRIQALQDFKDGKIQVLVATDIVARGIDIDGITHVVNHDFPVNPEDYVHRIGRTGRAEAPGQAISFVPEHDKNLLGILELFIGMRIPKRRLKGFNYHTPISAVPRSAQPARRDWRKRTREMEDKKATKPTGKQAPASPNMPTRKPKPGPPRGKKKSSQS